MSVSPTQTTTTWNIDTAHSTVEFSVKHMMISTVKGQFGAVEGTVELDPANLASASVDARIDTSTITTHNEMRDNHLRTNDFFNAEDFRYITFKSTSIEPKGDDEFKIHGDLTIRDATKPVTLDAVLDGIMEKDAFGKRRAAFSASTSINRKDFDVTFNIPLDGGKLLIGDKVDITLAVEAVKA